MNRLQLCKYNEWLDVTRVPHYSDKRRCSIVGPVELPTPTLVDCRPGEWGTDRGSGRTTNFFRPMTDSDRTRGRALERYTDEPEE